jgi:hypothetical protein
MMIVDEPFAAPVLIEYLEQTQQPILANEMGRKLAAQYNVNALEGEEFAARLNAGERLVCTSENAFSWIARHSTDASLTGAVATFKDKARMRKLLAPMYPELEYREVPTAELYQVRFEDLKTPFVLKPNVGYCSVGVYVVETRQQWDAALADIKQNMKVWRTRYSESALVDGSFIIESYLGGTEYAVDAYFDEQGKAVVLDLLRHEFRDAADTTDRCYITGPSLICEHAAHFEEWLNQVNQYVGAKNFPVHVETRMQNGRIAPIEFNPLRFAGICGTEVAYFAYGFHTYDYFLRGVRPNWDELLAGKEGNLYCMGYIPAPEPLAKGEAAFNYEAFEGHFSNLQAFYRFDPQATGALGFLFMQTTEADPTERAFLRDANLEQFLR